MSGFDRLVRRKFLLGAATVAAIGASSLKAAISSDRQAIDFADPDDGLRANVKLRGSLANEWVWRHYWGDVLAVLPEGA
ncbi:MAG: hypothetical protein RIC29_00005, partial [Rhodospirillaceae bacterium]